MGVLEELLKKPGTYNDLTYKALNAPAICGVEDGIKLLANTKTICKTYKKNEDNKYVAIIKDCLYKWLSKMKYKTRGEELYISKGFNGEMFDALKVFNLRFGINVKDAHTITKGHLKLFNDILAGNLDPIKKPEYAFKKDVDDFKRAIYGATSEKGPAKALKELGNAKSKLRRSMASRFGNLRALYGEDSIKSQFGVLTPYNVVSRLSIKNAKLGELLFKIKELLLKEGYILQEVTCGYRSGSDGGGGHPQGMAIDFTVINSKGHKISQEESKDIVTKIFREALGMRTIGENTPYFFYKNEYIENSRYKTGPHFHICVNSRYWPK